MNRVVFVSRLACSACALLLTQCHLSDEKLDCVDCVRAEAWTDPVTGLTWQEPQFSPPRAWIDAAEACDALVLAGHDDWRLPNLDELRSLARGCDATVTGGACGVTDACPETACSSTACDGCEEFGGPGRDGCYRPASLTGDCMTTWTASVVPDLPEHVWTVGFGGCHVLHFPKTQANLNPRCVRQQ